MKLTLVLTVVLGYVLLVAGCTEEKPKASVPPAEKAAAAAAPENFENVSTRLGAPAFGSVDGINEVTLPKPEATIAIKGDQIAIGGFFVDAVKADAAAGVVAMIAGKPFLTTYGGERPDIAKALDNPKYLKSQFYVAVPTSAIGKGLHELKMRVIASDKSGYYESGVVAKLLVE